MKNLRSLASLTIIILSSLHVCYAGVDPNTSSWKSQFTEYLEDINFQKYEDLEELMIDFIIIEGGEIIVLSTSTPEMETIVKSKLNYKIIEDESLESYRKYTLPVKFEIL